MPSTSSVNFWCRELRDKNKKMRPMSNTCLARDSTHHTWENFGESWSWGQGSKAKRLFCYVLSVTVRQKIFYYFFQIFSLLLLFSLLQHVPYEVFTSPSQLLHYTMMRASLLGTDSHFLGIEIVIHPSDIGYVETKNISGDWHTVVVWLIPVLSCTSSSTTPLLSLDSYVNSNSCTISTRSTAIWCFHDASFSISLFFDNSNSINEETCWRLLAPFDNC